MLNSLRHLFIPHHGNNHRSKLLHNSTIFFIASILLFLTFASIFVRNKAPDILGISYSISQDELLSLVNRARAKNSLPPLRLNEKLSLAGEEKARDMFSKDYWAHFAPDGTSPWYFIKKTGYPYVYAGENLAKGFTNSSEILNAWMASPTHKDNILSPNFQDIGFAVVEGKLLGEDTVLVVELFGSSEFPVALAPQHQGVSYGVKTKAQTESSPAAPLPSVQPKQATNVISESEQNNMNPTNTVYKNPLINLNHTPRTISFVIISTILITLLLDLIIIERKKIPRLVGHNIDHIMLISLFLLLLVIEKTGRIL